MRTLVVTVDPAFPPVSGADLRNWQNARAASRLGPVCLASLVAPSTVQPPSGITTVAYSRLDPSSPIWGPDLAINFPAEASASLRNLRQSFAPDAIVFESLALSPLLPQRECNAIRILDLHNIESDLLQQELRNIGLLEWRARFRLRQRLRRLINMEREAMGRIDRVWVCSARDQDRLRSTLSAVPPTRIVPNGIPGIPPSTLFTRNRPMHKGPVLIFVGHLGYGPNIEAAHLLSEMMPKLRRRLPNARLLIVGRSPDLQIQDRRSDFVTVVANPEELNSHLYQADLAILPLRRGGGTRIKALEAMAWGIPIVATARAVEGLDLEDGFHVRIAESASQFISQIADLTCDPAAYNAQRLESFLLVKRRFGKAAIEAAVAAGLSG